MSSRYLFSSVRWRQHRIHLCYKLTHTQTNTERPRLYLLGVLSLDLWRLTSRLLGWHTHKLFDTEAQCAEIKVHIIKPGETNCCHITLNTKRCSRLKTEVASYACWFFKAYTAAGHQGAMEMFWPHMLSIFIQSKVENNLTRHVSNIAKLQQKTNTRGINRVTLNASQSDVGTEVTVHFVPLWAQSAPNNEADVMLEEGHRKRTVN